MEWCTQTIFKVHAQLASAASAKEGSDWMKSSVGMLWKYLAFPIALFIEGQEMPWVVIMNANQTVPDMAPRQSGTSDGARTGFLSESLYLWLAVIPSNPPLCFVNFEEDDEQTHIHGPTWTQKIRIGLIVPLKKVRVFVVTPTTSCKDEVCSRVWSRQTQVPKKGLLLSLLLITHIEPYLRSGSHSLRLRQVAFLKKPLLISGQNSLERRKKAMCHAFQ